MRNLVVVLLLFGFVVGLAPLAWYLIGEATTDASHVIYYGSYEPLYGVTMSDETTDRLNRQFDRRSQGTYTTWLYALPFAAAAVGALAGTILGKFGYELTRKQTRKA